MIEAVKYARKELVSELDAVASKLRSHAANGDPLPQGLVDEADELSTRLFSGDRKVAEATKQRRHIKRLQRQMSRGVG